MTLNLVLTLLCFQSALCILNRTQDEPCKDSGKWICKLMKDCPWAKEILRKSEFPIICSFSGREPIVCCNVELQPVKPTLKLSFRSSLTSQKCAEYAKYVYELVESPVLTSDKILNISTCVLEAETLLINGVNAAEKEFPHMVRIGYSKGRRISWNCGGSLISEQFVLSAAHCSETKQLGPATWAGLGGLYLNRNENDLGRVDIKIQRRIVHPDYNAEIPMYNDIALFKLERPVEPNGYIRPICLPNSEEFPKTAIATGWGHTAFQGRPSQFLQKIQLSVISNELCNEFYKSTKTLTRGILPDAQLCAYEKSVDTCQGDSGGPLQILLSSPYCTYMQVGITSFGKGCNRLPGVYTNVGHFLQWIEKTTWGKL